MTTALDILAIAQDVLETRHIPTATYRLQFSRSFGFREARELIPYLHRLGISDCYASPLLKPRAGSSHGYDVSDHGALNPDLGSAEDFAALCESLHTHGMGLLLDMVPNHMGIDDESNAWWMDVLENGESSIYASYFDIDWKPVKPELAGKVLLPVLGDQYGKILESGQLRLSYQDGAFLVSYYEHVFPISPGTYDRILHPQLEALTARLGEDDEHVQELLSILTAISYLPPSNLPDPDKRAERNREKEVIKRRLDSLYQASADVQTAVDEAITRLNGTVGDPASFDELDDLINAQAYRLAFWRVAAEEINYRRFFDINDLAAIRVEEPDVFAASHQLILEMLAKGQATGLRIDHPDGLWDPTSYFRQLQTSYVARRILERIGEDNPDHPPEAVMQAVEGWFEAHLMRHGTAAPLPLYVVAEKILSEDEPLPIDWAVHGTTGYDFLNHVNGLFVDQSSEKAFDKLYTQFIGRDIEFRHLVNRTKKQIMNVSLPSQVYEISYRLERIAEKNRRYRDFTLNTLTVAIREIIACLPVYRTYVSEAGVMDERDQQFVDQAVQEARQRNPTIPRAIFDFLQEILTLRNRDDFAPSAHEELIHFIMKLQQITSPVMAKGLEDTAFYVYNRLIALNEVGGHPEQYGISLDYFHEQNCQRQQHWPHAMLTTSTHDTKRSEDVRARISVLSEMPNDWKNAITRWAKMNASKRITSNGQAMPDRNDEYLLYQTLVGTWNEEPPRSADFAEFRERIASYMMKATKEAKLHTSWVNANEQYDAAVRDFVFAVLDDTGKNNFLRDMMAFQRRVAFFGYLNALAQKLLTLTAPGMPDIYQGTELWDFSLVDPDNRRAVNYHQRDWLLDTMQRRIHRDGQNLVPLARELLDNWMDGRIKLYVIMRTLNFRRDESHLFKQGAYHPVQASGTKQNHVCAFARSKPDSGAPALVVVVPCLVAHLLDHTEQLPMGEKIWQDTRLHLPDTPAGQVYRNLFTGEALETSDQEGGAGFALAHVLTHFPVALLAREPGD